MLRQDSKQSSSSAYERKFTTLSFLEVKDAIKEEISESEHPEEPDGIISDLKCNVQVKVKVKQTRPEE